MVKIVLFLFFLLQCSSSLDPKRVHLVDQVKPQNQEFPNLLFRGNMPVNKTGFAIDQLVDLMRLRAKEGRKWGLIKTKKRSQKEKKR